MIDRGGEKIAPAEIEAALLAHPAVREAAAFSVPHAMLGEEVGVAVVLTGEADELDLRRHMARQLAPFKMPSHFVFADALPTTSNGKTLRIGLAAMFGLGQPRPPTAISEGVCMTDGHNSPLSAREIAVGALWSRVLRITEIDRDDDFFYLGGDSLTGVELLTLVHEAFNVDLPPLAMYDQANTVAKMARMIADTASKSAHA